MALGDGHDGRVDEAEVEVGVAGVDLDGAAQKTRREKGDGVLAVRERGEEETSGPSADPCPEELIDLDQHRLGNDQIPSELGDEGGRQQVGPVTPVRGGDDGPVSATTLNEPRRAL